MERWDLAKRRLVKPLPSRMRPSRRCSVSIELLPSCAASYRAKKITRLARSVYRSNIFSTRSLHAYYTTARKILDMWWFLHMSRIRCSIRTVNSMSVGGRQSNAFQAFCSCSRPSAI